MLTVRLHLDDCPASNGALRVIPKTHLLGRLSEATAAKIAGENRAVVCELNAGGALVMRPLLLDASSAASLAGHRRVITLTSLQRLFPAAYPGTNASNHLHMENRQQIPLHMV